MSLYCGTNVAGTARWRGPAGITRRKNHFTFGSGLGNSTVHLRPEAND
jgi:hypothetical protein